MSYPAEQTTRAARDVRPGDWVHDGSRWRQVVSVETVDGRTSIHLEPLVYDASESIGVCTSSDEL